MNTVPEVGIDELRKTLFRDNPTGPDREIRQLTTPDEFSDHGGADAQALGSLGDG